jgi:hypothetical protein
VVTLLLVVNVQRVILLHALLAQMANLNLVVISAVNVMVALNHVVNLNLAASLNQERHAAKVTLPHALLVQKVILNLAVNLSLVSSAALVTNQKLAALKAVGLKVKAAPAMLAAVSVNAEKLKN